MTVQYLRQLSVVVSGGADTEGIDFGNFWCVFNIRRGDFQTPNSCDVRIYNVAPATIQKIAQPEFSRLTVSAGYGTTIAGSNIALIFQGTICQFRIGRVDQLDSYVDITAFDGDEAYNFTPIFISVPAGNNQNFVAKQLLGVMESVLTAEAGEKTVPQTITAGYAPTFPSNQLIRGRVLYGQTRDELRDFAWTNNCKWSIQDGALTFIPYVAFIPAGQIPIISVSTGLLGVPEQTQQGIQIKVLLNNQIKVGQLIQLQSGVNQFRQSIDLPSQKTNTNLYNLTQLNPDGYYYVMVANHSGDTRGETWSTDLTCLSVDATTIDSDYIKNILNVSPATPIFRYGIGVPTKLLPDDAIS